MFDEVFWLNLTIQLRNRISLIRWLRENASMKMLASRIARELKQAKHYAVYEPELSRAWPGRRRSRETDVALFAGRHGWRLRYFKDGFCAIFDKDPSL
jgi:hypothetical protein